MRNIQEIFDVIELENERQHQNIELIASENYVSKNVLKAQGSILTNKYAEGYPGKRYYGGCQEVDKIETFAIEAAKELFKAKYVNVQPHSGSSANMAVYKALLKCNDTVLGMSLDQGGHLTHGHRLSFSGIEYNVLPYYLNKETEEIDYEALRELALKTRPKMIIAGASAYSREIDFKKFRKICDEVGAYLFVDMAHIAGLVAAGLHMNPCPYADVVTTTTHKTLRGPRGGMILTNDSEIAKKINRTVFPGIQGGPLMHVIAAKAVCFYEALTENFVNYQKQVIKNAKMFETEFKANGFRLVSGGTDNHLVLVDVKKSCNITGKEAEKVLDRCHITVNKNTIPYDTESPMVTSGIRIGSPAITSRGFKEKEVKEVTDLIITALRNPHDEEILNEVTQKVLNLTKRFGIRKND